MSEGAVSTAAGIWFQHGEVPSCTWNDLAGAVGGLIVTVLWISGDVRRPARMAPSRTRKLTMPLAPLGLLLHLLQKRAPLTSF